VAITVGSRCAMTSRVHLPVSVRSVSEIAICATEMTTARRENFREWENAHSDLQNLKQLCHNEDGAEIATLAELVIDADHAYLDMRRPHLARVALDATEGSLLDRLSRDHPLRLRVRYATAQIEMKSHDHKAVA
jgi:hypothetical protein